MFMTSDCHRMVAHLLFIYCFVAGNVLTSDSAVSTQQNESRVLIGKFEFSYSGPLMQSEVLGYLTIRLIVSARHSAFRIKI